MAYKVVCTKCGHPVKIEVNGTNQTMAFACKCHATGPVNPASTWSIQASGVIPTSDRQKYCTGCEDNFYNGNNSVNVKECWSLKSAKVVKKKKVGINDTPPWKHQPVVTTLSCFHCKGYVFLTDPKRLY